MTVAYPDHSHLLFVVFILYIQLNSECIITQKFIVNVLKDQSLSKYLDSLHVVVRFGCGFHLLATCQVGIQPNLLDAGKW